MENIQHAVPNIIPGSSTLSRQQRADQKKSMEETQVSNMLRAIAYDEGVRPDHFTKGRHGIKKEVLGQKYSDYIQTMKQNENLEYVKLEIVILNRCRE